ncbi:hypothetical protein [Asticcacaulis sp. AND118]|uniref:hypothetical protein n=1 Tax=Asticcacaulis sp. AND118 TaxID=2840468 RepID=UPI001CFFD502|nr:hypothetical protein [Asticcacaulis sp. AND118]UDF04045.1 hypothetical protein LH365_03085 [Asticcacaulis sp. AND118]
MAGNGWFKDRLVWPQIHSLIGAIIFSALGAGALWAGQGATVLSGQCSAATEIKLEHGQFALLNRNLESARAVGSDVKIEAPNCAEANAFLAELSAQEMQTLTKPADKSLRELKRVDCYERAIAASRMPLRPRTKVGGLLRLCGATAQLASTAP